MKPYRPYLEVAYGAVQGVAVEEQKGVVVAEGVERRQDVGPTQLAALVLLRQMLPRPLLRSPPLGALAASPVDMWLYLRTICVVAEHM